MEKSWAVLGGDARQCYLARLLDKDGARVVTWGLEKGNAPHAAPLDQALEAEIVILPLPVCRGENIVLPLSDARLSVGELWKRLRPEQIVFGGMAHLITQQLGDHYLPEVLDYYEREEVQVEGAAATAEGAIMRAMEETRHTLQGSSCLVVGYGRIGKLLAHTLRALGAEVTVSARKLSDLAWIAAYGYRPIHTGDIASSAGNFDVIFNTVPVCVLDAQCIRQIKTDCLIIELASLPGGIDENAVKEKGLRVFVERGLPGKTAPESAARSIRDGIYHILEERGISR